MNNQIVGYRVSYFVFAFFISCFVVFSIHKGFKPIDIITIPVFALLLFLVIDFSAQFVYQRNLEQFITENYLDHNDAPISKEDLLESFDDSPKEVEIQNTPLFKKFAAYEENPQEEEEQQPLPPPPEEQHQEEEHMIPHHEEEESFAPKPTPSSSGSSKTPSADKKASQATKKQKQRPDINRHHMDDGRNDLENLNKNAINPININVSYNNNRPYTVNDFNDVAKKNNDLNKYRFDDGRQKKNTVSFETTTPSSLLNPVNNTTVNAALSDINQRYYPAYLENPLNKEQQGVDVKSVFDSNEYKNNLLKQKEANMRANPAILQRKPHWTQSNYETTMMKKILNQKNDPAPVLLDRPWSEWKPIEE